MTPDSIDTTVQDNRDDDGYPGFQTRIISRFENVRANDLFTTDVNPESLYHAYLSRLPAEAAQHYTCRACENFIKRYGGLVIIDERGKMSPAFWSVLGIPTFFEASVLAMRELVQASNVTGVFLSSEKVYGTPQTGDWHHIHAYPLASRIWTINDENASRTADQQMALLVQGYQMLTGSLEAFPLKVAQQAYKLISTNAVDRAEKTLGPSKFFYELHVEIKKATGAQRENLIWRAVASSPHTFHHINSNVIGSLMEDISNKTPVKDLIAKFNAKMKGTDYQRPKAAPTEGQVQAADKLFTKMGAEGSLRRRPARVEEIPLIWSPLTAKKKAADLKVFGEVKTKKASKSMQKQDDVVGPPVNITWEKFRTTVLDTAISIELFAQVSHFYSALLTAVVPDAPAILQWDSPENRNPVSWYFREGTSTPSEWNLQQGWVKVTGICFKPTMWQPGFDHFGKGVLFILEGCRETRKDIQPGNCLFPETMKSMYHGIRAVIEAYAKITLIENPTEGTAGGVMGLDTNQNWGYTIRVKTNLGMVAYTLDRWD